MPVASNAGERDMSRTHTIGRVAVMTGLTVRALHHYDDIGLVSPSQRSAAGYRLYTDADLRRLQQVLLFRELGLGLEVVRTLVDAPADQRRDVLVAQREALLQRRRDMDNVLQAVDATLQSLDGDTPMTTERLFDGYSQFHNGEYAQEAEQRWGRTDAWAISRQRGARRTKEDWADIQAEADAITRTFLDAMLRGDTADSGTTMAIAECHREHIDRHFYPFSHAMHANVAALYVNDPRFQAHYDQHAPGLAAYIEAAVRANADAHAQA